MRPQRFRKVPFSSVYTYTRKQRFQKVPLWRAFSKISFLLTFLLDITVDGSRIRKEKVAFSNESVYVWTGPKLLKAQNLNIVCKRFSRKQNVLPDNVFLFKTLHVTPRRHICLTQAVILSSTSNFFATIAALWKNMTTSSQKYNWRLRFSPP